MENKKEYKFGTPEKPEEESLTGYREASEKIVKLGENLIQERHYHLRDARIAYLVSEDEIKYQGKVVPGRLYKVNDREKTEIKKDFMLVIGEPTWDPLSEKEREAAMDHILCFGTINSDGGYKLQKPDFHGFYSNVSEYGLWNRNLKELGKRVSQMKLPFDKDDREVMEKEGIEIDQVVSC